MKLYFNPGVCSLSPHIALRELGLPFELVEKRRFVAEGGDFRTINPKNAVPVLELDDGRRLTEGTAIVQYLADLKPEAGLLPALGSWERYRAQEWLNYIATEIHKGFSPLFNPKLENKGPFYESLSERLAWLDGHLDAQGPFLMGERFTVADGYLFTVLRWTGRVHIDLTAYPALRAYQQRIEARPAVAEALKAEAHRS